MTRPSMRSVISPLLVTAVVLSLTGCSSTPRVNLEAEEKAVLAAEADFSDAAASKDLEKVVAFYAEDSVMLQPNESIVRGKAGIRAAWERNLAMPDLTIGWKADKAEVAKAGDMAFDYGSYTMSFTDPAGKKVEDHGKYTTIWKKLADGSWKVAVDIYNTDQAAPQPAVAKKKAAAKPPTRRKR